MKLKNTCWMICLIMASLACRRDAPAEITSNKESTSLVKEGEVTTPDTSGKLLPVDEGKLRPDFDRFRTEVIAAMDRKDVNFLKQIIDDNVQVSYGADNGKQAFIEKFGLNENPDQSVVWQELKKVMLMGGRFSRSDKNAFMAPYVGAHWPEGIDPLEFLAITHHQVMMREAPSLEAKVISSLEYDIVARVLSNEDLTYLEMDGERWPWIKVKTADGISGYVLGKYIHSPTDYRAFFKQKGVRWYLVSLVAGD